MNETKLSWKDGTPDNAGCPGWFWVADEEGDKEVIEVDMDGDWKSSRAFGEVVAYCGPIQEPDDETLP